MWNVYVYLSACMCVLGVFVSSFLDFVYRSELQNALNAKQCTLDAHTHKIFCLFLLPSSSSAHLLWSLLLVFERSVYVGCFFFSHTRPCACVCYVSFWLSNASSPAKPVSGMTFSLFLATYTALTLAFAAVASFFEFVFFCMREYVFVYQLYSGSEWIRLNIRDHTLGQVQGLLQTWQGGSVINSSCSHT